MSFYLSETGNLILPFVINEALKHGKITNVINAASVSPSQAPVNKILEVDL